MVAMWQTAWILCPIHTQTNKQTFNLYISDIIVVCQRSVSEVSEIKNDSVPWLCRSLAQDIKSIYIRHLLNYFSYKNILKISQIWDSMFLKKKLCSPYFVSIFDVSALLTILKINSYKLIFQIWKNSTRSTKTWPFFEYGGKSGRWWSSYGPMASIFYKIWIEQSGAMVFILNLDKISLKKLFPTMNI